MIPREELTVAACGHSAASRETPTIPDVLDQLYRTIHLTELTFMATMGIDDDRLKSAFAVSLDQIGEELRASKAALDEILRDEREREGLA
jgi:hypothetical protein